MMEREGGKRQTESGRHEKEARLAVISSESVKTLPSIGLKTDIVRVPVLFKNDYFDCVAKKKKLSMNLYCNIVTLVE